MIKRVNRDAERGDATTTRMAPGPVAGQTDWLRRGGNSTGEAWCAAVRSKPTTAV